MAKIVSYLEAGNQGRFGQILRTKTIVLEDLTLGQWVARNPDVAVMFVRDIGDVELAMYKHALGE